MNNGRKTIIKIQAILFAVLFAAFAFAGCKNNDNNKADENGFTAEQRTVLCDAARAFYLLDFDYNSKDNAISFRQLEEFAFYVYAYGDSLETTAADNSGYRSVDGQKVDDIVKCFSESSSERVLPVRQQSSISTTVTVNIISWSAKTLTLRLKSSALNRTMPAIGSLRFSSPKTVLTPEKSSLRLQVRTAKTACG